VTIYTIILYFSFMFSLISIIRLIPFARSNRNTLFIRFILVFANMYSVFFFTKAIGIVPIVIVIFTLIFTEAYEYLKKYISKHFIKLIRSDSFLLKLNLMLTFNTNSFGFLEMVKAIKAFDNNDYAGGEEILLHYTERVQNDLSWVSNCIIFLTNIHQSKTAFSILEKISIDLSKNNIPYQFLQIAIQLFCDNNEFELAEFYLDYMEEHFYDAQHKFPNIQSFLYYYARRGDERLFNKIIVDFPDLLKFPILPELRNILHSSDTIDKISRVPKTYHFEMTKVNSQKTFPLYIFAGIICVITLLVLIFSRGGSFSDRVFSGEIYPIDYIKYGASVKYLIFKGEWIRLLTPVFLHAGLLHLALNMFALLNIGRALLRYFDKFILLFIFLAGAVLGNVVSLFFSSALLSVGASGGVFSILGALFIYLIWHKKEINKTLFHRILVNFAVILAIQIIFGLQNSNIDNYAHLGGFLGGVLLTTITLFIKKTKFQNFYSGAVKIILFLTTISLMLLWPRMLSQNQFEKFVLTEDISESGIEYSIPSTWEKTSDRYIDPLSSGQIIFNSYDGLFQKSDLIAAIKETYTKDNKYHVGRESELGNRWSALEFVSNALEDSYNLYYFSKNGDDKTVEAYLFLTSELSDEYLPFFEKVLYSVK
jgi:membrane associated rhomboid family serine protease